MKKIDRNQLVALFQNKNAVGCRFRKKQNVAFQGTGSKVMKIIERTCCSRNLHGLRGRMDKFLGKNNPVMVAKYKETTFSTDNH